MNDDTDTAYEDTPYLPTPPHTHTHTHTRTSTTIRQFACRETLNYLNSNVLPSEKRRETRTERHILCAVFSHHLYFWTKLTSCIKLLFQVR